MKAIFFFAIFSLSFTVFSQTKTIEELRQIIEEMSAVDSVDLATQTSEVPEFTELYLALQIFQIRETKFNVWQEVEGDHFLRAHRIEDLDENFLAFLGNVFFEEIHAALEAMVLELDRRNQNRSLLDNDQDLQMKFFKSTRDPRAALAALTKLNKKDAQNFLILEAKHDLRTSESARAQLLMIEPLALEKNIEGFKFLSLGRYSFSRPHFKNFYNAIFKTSKEARFSPDLLEHLNSAGSSASVERFYRSYLNSLRLPEHYILPYRQDHGPLYSGPKPHFKGRKINEQTFNAVRNGTLTSNFTKFKKSEVLMGDALYSKVKLLKQYENHRTLVKTFFRGNSDIFENREKFGEFVFQFDRTNLKKILEIIDQTDESYPLFPESFKKFFKKSRAYELLKEDASEVDPKLLFSALEKRADRRDRGLTQKFKNDWIQYWTEDCLYRGRAIFRVLMRRSTIMTNQDKTFRKSGTRNFCSSLFTS